MRERPSSAGPKYGFGSAHRESIYNLHAAKYPGRTHIYIYIYIIHIINKIAGNYENKSTFD